MGGRLAGGEDERAEVLHWGVVGRSALKNKKIVSAFGLADALFLCGGFSLLIKLRENHPDANAFDIDAILSTYRAAVILGD